MRHIFSAENDLEGEFNVEVDYYVEHDGEGDYDVVIISAKREDGSNYPLGDEQRDKWETYLTELLLPEDIEPVRYDPADGAFDDA